jgi:hypothetical protein
MICCELWSRNGDTYTWQFDSQPAGTYEVYMWWSGYTSRASSIDVEILNANGTNTVNINQKLNAGQWNSLGQFQFNGSGSVTIIAANGSTVSTSADAVWFRYVSADVPTETVLDATALLGHLSLAHGQLQAQVDTMARIHSGAGMEQHIHGPLAPCKAVNTTCQCGGRYGRPEARAYRWTSSIQVALQGCISTSSKTGGSGICWGLMTFRQGELQGHNHLSARPLKHLRGCGEVYLSFRQ